VSTSRSPQSPPGHAVIATARNAESIAAALGEHQDLLAVQLDVTDEAETEKAVRPAIARFGRIDVLVNNAGINPTSDLLADVSQELWRKIFAVNLEGPVRLSTLVAPIMRDNGGGSIVNIATVGAYIGPPRSGAYGASKAGLINATKTLSKELAPWNIRVNAISPGPIKSELTEGAEAASPGFYERAGSATTMKRVAETEEIIGPVLYLASDAASYVTGEDHIVAGGMARG
jgi:NAD(P)-dependent dehydrogenase (short-subunit alcohol dehydrogenase family)